MLRLIRGNAANRCVAALVLICAIAGAARADSVLPPRRSTFESANRQWRFVSDPRQGLTLEKRRAIGWRIVSRPARDHYIADVLVANDGTYATIGRPAVAIYRPSGELVRALELEDILDPEDIPWLPHTVSSIRWSGAHRIDDVQRMLVLRVAGNDIPLSLDTGEMLVEKRAFFPKPRVRWEGNNVVTARAVTAPVPEYPEVARKLRAAGIVILEFVITENGSIEDMRVLKSMPFGLTEAAQKAVSGWTFAPGERAIANVTVHFEFVQLGTNDAPPADRHDRQR